jgi:hypothetical protein
MFYQRNLLVRYNTLIIYYLILRFDYNQVHPLDRIKYLVLKRIFRNFRNGNPVSAIWPLPNIPRRKQPQDMLTDVDTLSNVGTDNHADDLIVLEDSSEVATNTVDTMHISDVVGKRNTVVIIKVNNESLQKHAAQARIESQSSDLISFDSNDGEHHGGPVYNGAFHGVDEDNNGEN